MSDTYEATFTIWITSADQCSTLQGQYPNGILTSPQAAATTYSAPVDPAAPTFSDGQCIWTYGNGNGNAGLSTSLASVTIPPNFVITSHFDLSALSGAPGGTLQWRGFFLFRGTAGTNPAKEPLQTHRWMVGFERPVLGEGLTTSATTQRQTRNASRTAGGLGLSLRSPAVETVTMALPTTGTGFPTKSSWERVYVKLLTYPTA